MDPSTPSTIVNMIESSRSADYRIGIDEMPGDPITRPDQLSALSDRILSLFSQGEYYHTGSHRVDAPANESVKDIEEVLQKALEILKVCHATQQDHISSLYSQIQKASELMTTNIIRQRENTNPEQFEKFDMLAQLTHAGYSRVYDKVNLRMDNERNILNLRYRACVQAEHMTRQVKKAKILRQQIAEGTYTYIHEEKREVPDGSGGMKTVLEQWDVVKQCDIGTASQDLIEIEMSIKASSRAIKDMIEAEDNENTKIVMKTQGALPLPQIEDFQRPQRSGSRVPWQI